MRTTYDRVATRPILLPYDHRRRNPITLRRRIALALAAVYPAVVAVLWVLHLLAPGR
jgi:hypothetical protein